jgi:hypothetical protein
VQNTLGPFLEVTSPTGLAHWFEIAANGFLDAMKQPEGDAEAAMGVLRELSDRLWLHLANIGEAAAPTESFALFFVDINVREIGKMEIFVYRRLRDHIVTLPEPHDRESASRKWHYEHFATEFLRDLDWLIGAVYWRIYKALPTPVRSNLVWNFFDTLQELGITAMEADLDKQAINAIQHLSSLVTAILEKPLEGAYDPSRAAAYIAKIGMAALHRDNEGLVTSSLEALRKLQTQFRTKFAGNQELETSLLHGVDEVVEDLERGRPSLDEVAIHFTRSVTPEAVAAYVERLHQTLHVG